MRAPSTYAPALRTATLCAAGDVVALRVSRAGAAPQHQSPRVPASSPMTKSTPGSTATDVQQVVEGVGRVVSCQISCSSGQPLGIQVGGGEAAVGSGFGPVFVSGVQTGSAAQRAGVCSGDLIVAINGHNMRDASRQASQSMFKEARRAGDMVAVVLRKVGAAPSTLLHGVRRAVLQRQALGLGFAIGRSATRGHIVEFVAAQGGPVVLTGEIQTGDEVVAIDGHSVSGLPFEQAVQVLRSVGTVFELLLRDPRSQHSALASNSHGYLNPTPLPAHGPLVGCRVVSIERHPEGCGFAVTGGIDTDRHGIFVSMVAENGPADGKLIVGDLVIWVDNQPSINLPHSAAVNLLKMSAGRCCSQQTLLLPPPPARVSASFYSPLLLAFGCSDA